MNNFLKMLFGKDYEQDQEIGAFERKDRKSDQEIGTFDGPNVSWQPAANNPGDTIRINYHGLLKNSGADTVFLHYAFNNWESGVNTMKMEKMGDGDFGVDINAAGSHNLNFCFKDSANNWDNNNGTNWYLDLQ